MGLLYRPFLELIIVSNVFKSQILFLNSFNLLQIISYLHMVETFAKHYSKSESTLKINLRNKMIKETLGKF